MGGGYRLKSAESCRDTRDSLQIGPPHRIRPTPSPRASREGERVSRTSNYPAAQDENRHHPVRSSNQSQVNSGKQTRREQETAEIEREYIHNLQKQVYFLELELESVKKQQVALPTREEEHFGTEHGYEVVEGLKAKLSDIEQRYAPKCLSYQFRTSHSTRHIRKAGVPNSGTPSPASGPTR